MLGRLVETANVRLRRMSSPLLRRLVIAACVVAAFASRAFAKACLWKVEVPR
jgi:hypothetical protein